MEIQSKRGCPSGVLLLLLLIMSPGCQRKSEKAVANGEIHDCFHRFSDAVSAGDGESAAAELSTETVSYYGRLKDAALRSSPDDLREAPLDLRLEVLKLRGRMTADELSAIDGRELAARFISQRWANNTLLSQISLGNIIHTRRGAEARYADNLGPTKSRLVFRQESDGWKFDLSAAAWMQRKVLYQIMESKGLSERELIAAALKEESTSGRSIEELWRPLRSAESADNAG